VTAIAVHTEYGIALQCAARRLEDQLRTVVREICLGILAAEGQLAQVFEVFLAGQWCNVNSRPVPVCGVH
jgi:hypothetical protein